MRSYFKSRGSDGAQTTRRGFTSARAARDAKRRLTKKIDRARRGTTDPLDVCSSRTGLPNRRSLDEEIRRELARAARMRYQLSVAMLDIDLFKAYNDRHGHAAGDRLLREAANAWRVALRETDFIARYGGEEFVVLLPSCPPGNAPEILQRLRAATPAGQTVSGGIARWDGRESPETLLSRADHALYEAKHTGRDCLIAARPN